MKWYWMLLIIVGLSGCLDVDVQRGSSNEDTIACGCCGIVFMSLETRDNHQGKCDECL